MALCWPHSIIYMTKTLSRLTRPSALDKDVYSSSSSSRRSPLILSSSATKFNSAIAIAMAEFSFISMLLSPSQRINTLAWGNERSEQREVN